MDRRFKDSQLERLHGDATFTGGYSDAVVSLFRRRMQLIRDAKDERDFYALKSLHFEKLKGDRAGQYSMRLNDQWRLIVEFEGEPPNKVVVIVSILDYH